MLSLALQNLGIKASSLLGDQIKIHTDSAHGKARILDIDTDKLLSYVDSGVVPVIAGFQGVDVNNNITTLGRGGSDTSAVAVAAAIKAIYQSLSRTQSFAQSTASSNFSRSPTPPPLAK